jgi:dihydroorotate dehydrogenase (fumarate)
MDLSTSVAGIPLINPLMNASGCWCNDTEQLDQISSSKSAAIVSKSGTLLPRNGNEHQRLYIDDMGAINSMGLPNAGYKYYYWYNLPGLSTQKSTIFKPYFQSIHPFTPNELDIMMPELLGGSIELNISCPNVESKSNMEMYEQYFDSMRCHQLDEHIKLWGVKLPPFFHSRDFEHMSRLLLKYGAKFITSINSVPNGLFIDSQKYGMELSNKIRITPRGGLGGVSGKYIKPFGLANVYQFKKLLGNKIDIIGCGGVSTGLDVMDYLTVGAKAVQIGSQLLREGPACFARIEAEFTELKQKEQMFRKKLSKL